ncbi:MAG: hypothetical protein HGA26_04730 [Chlorobiaceae bacterium]|nr:hypothetical protein [Chlorobiaceae bacterium]
MKPITILLYLFVSLAARTGFAEEAAVSPARKTALETLAENHSYRLLSPEQTVVLKNGSFSGGADGISAKLAAFAITDMNGDGRLDVAVIIEHHAGGNPSVSELSLLLDTAEGFEQSFPVSLGETVAVRRLYVEEASLFVPKTIAVSFVSGSLPDTPAHPARDVRKNFYLEGRELKDAMSMEVVKKPALYLYPEKVTKVEVRLAPKGRITRTIPSCSGKWSVTVGSDGRIERKYRYLFYEAALTNPIAQPEEGWCVRRADLRSWMDSRLPRLGLSRQETRDFKVYWLKNLPKSEFWIVRLIRPEVVEDQLGLIINPSPRSLLRLLFYFTPSESQVRLREPEIQRFERKGFTAVEWGGILGGRATKDQAK